MLYFGNKHIVEAYLGTTPVSHIDIEGNGILIPIKNRYIILIYSAEEINYEERYFPKEIIGKTSDWLEEIEDKETTIRTTIRASSPVSYIRFVNGGPPPTGPTNVIYPKLKSVDFIDISNITSMEKMFANCEKLSFINTSGWNTSNVTNMNRMFSWCKSLTQLDVSNFNTSNVTDMGAMFASCWLLINLDVSNFNTSKVTDMNNMFANCKSLTKLDVSNFDTSNVTDMSDMFEECEEFTELDVSNFNTSNVTDMRYMFSYCKSLQELDLSNFDTSKVTNMDSMFYNCKSLTKLDIRNFNMTNITDAFDMQDMFSGCPSLYTLRLDNCSNDTINKIITSYGFPKIAISGVTRTIYCKEAEAQGLTAPEGWSFSFV